jgi:transposase-like protein
MANHRTRPLASQLAVADGISIQIPMPMLEALVDARQMFFDLCVFTGRQTLRSMMEADRDAVCGPKGKQDVQRTATRGGSTPSWITLGGCQVRIPRLRARSGQGELVLPSFAWAADRDPLDARTLEAIAAGASMRKYPRTLETLSSEISQRSTSRSSVSRRFVALSQERLQEHLSRPIEREVRIVMIDGKVFEDHYLRVALGIRTDGIKRVLGLWEGTRENASVVKALLQDLVGRGLVTDRPMLFVIDGSKALRKAIGQTFGKLAVVQRCQQHKRVNVREHLPARLRPSVERALTDAWKGERADLAQRQLERLASSLERDHPGAAASLREGLEETLTLQRLGASGWLYKTLCTTNPIENLNGSLERYTCNVKRWRGGSMIQRWAASALVEAERKFRRIRGHRDLHRLIAALDALRPGLTHNAKVA